MALFHGIVYFLSRMHRGSTWNLSYASTCTMFQSMMRVGSWIYFFNNETSKTLWNFKFLASSSSYTTGLIRVKTLNGPQNLGSNLEQFCNFSDVYYLGWFSLMSTLEESLVANSNSPNSMIKGLLFDWCIMVWSLIYLRVIIFYMDSTCHAISGGMWYVT
jgi:hypothetical protein